MWFVKVELKLIGLFFFTFPTPSVPQGFLVAVLIARGIVNE